MYLIHRRHFLKTSLALGSMASLGALTLRQTLAGEQGFQLEPDKPLIPAPAEPSPVAAVPAAIDRLAGAGPPKTELLSSALRKGRFSLGSLELRLLFPDAVRRNFLRLRQPAVTPSESFLNRARREFGGFDSIVLWHAYPRIGFDSRNQFDFYRDTPGGLKGLRALVKQLHREGLKVYIDYNPWDTGTRREGKNDLDALAELVGGLDADGIFLDTMDRGGRRFPSQTRCRAAKAWCSKARARCRWNACTIIT